MGNICIVLNSSKVNQTPDLKKHLVFAKRSGKKFACITYPDPDEVEIEAYRVQYWSPEAKCIFEYNVEASDEEELSDNIPYANIPTQCPQTGGPLLDFNETIDAGIICPHCGEQLKQSRWFTNEA